MLASVKVPGLVAVPVNFRLMGEEIRYIVENCEAVAFVIQDELVHAVFIDAQRNGVVDDERDLRVVDDAVHEGHHGQELDDVGGSVAVANDCGERRWRRVGNALSRGWHEGGLYLAPKAPFAFASRAQSVSFRQFRSESATLGCGGPDEPVSPSR